MAGKLNRVALTVRLQNAINNYQNDQQFFESLSRHVSEDACDDLTEDERWFFVEMKDAMAHSDAQQTRELAKHLVGRLPRPEFADKTSRILNWIMAICGILGVLAAMVTVLIALQPRAVAAASSTTAATVNPGRAQASGASPVGATGESEKRGRDSQGIPPLMRLLHPVQLVVVIALVFVQRKWFQRAGKQFQSSGVIAAQTLVQFRRGWMAMWWAWALLYGWFTFSALFLGDGKGVLAFGDVVNSLTGLAVWWCFLALDLPSVNLPGQERRDAGFRRATLVASVAALCCGLLACVDRYYNLGHFGVATVGIFNGLALACLAGRFTSHWMRLPRWQIMFIHGYAMMQLIYPFFDVLKRESDLWEPAVYAAVLMMKVMLAYTLRCAVNEGGLDNYLEAAQSGLLGFANDPEVVSAAAA